MPHLNAYQKEAKAILNLYLQKASRYEQKEMILLANKWDVVSKNLEDLIAKLSEQTNLSEDKLFKLDIYKQFLAESNKEVSKFNNYALGLVKEGQSQFIDLGLSAAQDSIKVFSLNFYKMNKDAVNNMIGLTSKGSPLESLFAKSYPESITKLSNTLINATALGYNPEKTARLLAVNMDGNLKRALTIARSEQLGCMRETLSEQMIQSGVVKNKIRLEQPDCCDTCADENGKEYDLDEDADFHPNCRGCWIPNV